MVEPARRCCRTAWDGGFVQARGSRPESGTEAPPEPGKNSAKQPLPFCGKARKVDGFGSRKTDLLRLTSQNRDYGNVFQDLERGVVVMKSLQRCCKNCEKNKIVIIF